MKSFIRSVDGTYCYLFLSIVVRPFPDIIFGFGFLLLNVSFGFFLLNVSSMASWKPSWVQIWSNGKAELEGAPKRCDERRRVVECVPASVFCLGTARGSLIENCFSKVYNSPKGRERLQAAFKKGPSSWKLSMLFSVTHKCPSLNMLSFSSLDIKILSRNKTLIKFCGEDPRNNSELKDQV